MPNIAPLPKTLYNNNNGDPKDQETLDTRYEAWDAEQMSGKTNEIITDVNANTDEVANKIEATDYAQVTVGGTLKARLDGDVLYLTNDGTDA